MKKFITPILSTALIALMTTGIFAAGGTVSQETSSLNTTQAQQVNQEQKAERANFKAQVEPLRAERKANREENLALREQNKALYEQIKGKLSTLKASETKLSKEQKGGLKTIKADIKALRSEIQSTEGQVKAVLEANKENFKNMNLEAVQSAFEEVYKTQTYRHDRLAQINTKLGQMLSTLG